MRLERNVILDKYAHLLQYDLELISDIIRRFQMSVIEEILETPVNIHVLSFVLMECIHHCQVISFQVNELSMSIVSFNHFFFWS